jgi:hypothetical protein
MTKPNNPYARPINATRPDAVLVSEHYGQRSTDKRRSHETGNREVSPANRFQSGVTAVPAWPDEAPAPAKRKRAPRATPSPEPTTLNSDATSPSDDKSITEDDLFG